MAKNLGDDFKDIQTFINQLEGAKLIDETGKPYTITSVRGPPIAWSADPKRVIYTAKYDDGTEVKVAILGDAYFHKHKFIKTTSPEEDLMVDADVAFPPANSFPRIPGLKDALDSGNKPSLSDPDYTSSPKTLPLPDRKPWDIPQI